MIFIMSTEDRFLVLPSWLRWAGVSLIIWLMVYPKIIRYKKILVKRWLYLFCMGAIGFTCFNILFYISAHSTTAINIGILQGALPVFVLLGAFFIFRETIRPIQLLGITITILGVVIVATEGDRRHRKGGVPSPHIGAASK